MPELLDQLTAALSDRYAIERQIGAGGMATVYLARDLKHERKVALKLLNPDLGVVLGADRFLSEIRVTANLQHPNLLPLFDSGEADGLLYYVMPYIDGESLRETLKREKQLPVDDALRIATAVASALDYAHRHGVIHRDLKPENILLHEGQPLVADFGIALAVSNAGGNRITQTGLSLGTPQYMSPEQATGDRVIDGRTDIYSLGAVLYEMLSGDPPHMGSNSQAIIARVLTEKPRSIRVTRPNVPEHVERAVDRALEKLSADRFSTAHEFADALMGRLAPVAVYTTSAPPAAPSAVAPRITWRQVARHPITIALGVTTLAAAAFGVWASRSTVDEETVPVRFQLVLPPDQGQVAVLVGPLFAVSPDGRTYTYTAAPAGGVPKLYLRGIDEVSARAVPGTDSAIVPAFSPDGRWLAFQSRGQLKKIEIGGATAIRMADLPEFAAGVSWGRDRIVLGSLNGGLRTVPLDGGTITEFAALDTAQGETSHRAPKVLQDGETVLFASFGRGGLQSTRVGVASLRTGKNVRLSVSGVPLGVVSGMLVYHDLQGAILGVPFDASDWRVTGGAIPLVDEVAFTLGGAVRAALSLNGSLIYLAGGASTTERDLIAVSLDGTERVVTNLRRPFTQPRYSPDGQRIVVTISRDTVLELWIYDLLSQTLSPLTRGLRSARAEWSPDGKYVVYSSNRSGKFELWRQPADGSGPAERIQPADSIGQPVQGVLSPDQRYLIYRSGYQTPAARAAGGGSDDLFYRATTGDTAIKRLSAEPYTERNTVFSPDGKWVAYSSTETGSDQIYVRPFPGPGPRYPVTVNGGNSPVWSPDGTKLYYRAGNNGARMEEATLIMTPQFAVTRRVLFERPYIEDVWHRNYDLSRDGKHFLVVRSVGAADQAPTFIVHNWAAEVRARSRGSRK